MSPSASLIDRIESIPRRELYFFALYRVLIASVIAALLYSPLSAMVGEAHHPRLADTVAAIYLVLSLLALVIGRNERWLRPIVVSGVLVDIVAATLLSHALPGASAGISMSLLFNIAAAASFLTPIGYQTNLMVYGPGGYRFGDFLRVGGPLSILVGLVTLALLPWIWPL